MLKRISVGNKLEYLLFSAMLGVIIISALALHSKYQRMLDDRRATLKAWCKRAIGVLDHYDKQVKPGHMPLSAAQDQAKRTIGNLRYAGKVLQPVRYASAHGLAPDQTRAQRQGFVHAERPQRQIAGERNARRRGQPGQRLCRLSVAAAGQG